MLHSYARSKARIMVGYVHDSTTLWRIWGPEHNTVKAQSDVIFDKVYTMMSQKRLPKLTYSVCRKKRHTEEIDTSGTDESMTHGRTQDTSEMGESMSHGRTDEVACRPVAGNPAVAGAHSDLPLAGHSTNGHGD
jgi:hypothetical protein